MPSPADPVDLLPNTPTALFLKTSISDHKVAPFEAASPDDPDAKTAATCKPKRYIVADPDAPDAPVCKPNRYIVAPDPGTIKKALPQWAKNLGEDLAERFR